MATPTHRDAFGNVWERNTRIFSNESFDQFVLALNHSLMFPSDYYRQKGGSDARRRAAKLLLSQLSEKQQAQLRRTGKFQVFTGKGLARRRFWIENNDRVYNVHGWFLKYCAITYDRSMPVEDETLGKKLLLETNPDAFFAVANVEQRQWIDKAILFLGAAGALFVVYIVVSVIGKFVAAVLS